MGAHWRRGTPPDARSEGRMTHDEAFLEALGEAPQDDAPRLVDAD
jgi:hypothetical protein